ncbi:PQ loop repeat-domain-containing protein [Fimicolochytrium jonesii]|uniref:PQ loop repeat-domain-containing protein n=1 Tax=Fimicolochytrium jonesii TaxID=1396493 RepID=UPI0022FDC337|nr:PQ loop repeat-domain-containing protein [Fimicolochytrium jonesii]KAI8817352.1 PQ loop repeat-domain-containing protein [Fimicolochytrium jonesii]
MLSHTSEIYPACSAQPTSSDLHAHPLLQMFLQRCAYTHSEVFAQVFAYASMTFWLCAQMPQLWRNYKRKNADGLSGAFLANWLLGDVCNLAGCILTNQLPFQTGLATYFVFADVTLLAQYIYYTRVRPAPIRRNSRSMLIPLPTSASHASLLIENTSMIDPTETSALLSLRRTQSSTAFFGVMLFGFSNLLTGAVQHSQSTGTPSAVISPPPEFGVMTETPAPSPSLAHIIGVITAYLCMVLYLSSRIPQIIRNFRRRSTEGLAMSMFGCAAFGNLTYVLSILCTRRDPDFLKGAAPYLIGSGGTLIFDAIIFTQWWFLGGRQTQRRRWDGYAFIGRPDAKSPVLADEDLLVDVEDNSFLSSLADASEEGLFFVKAAAGAIRDA